MTGPVAGVPWCTQGGIVGCTRVGYSREAYPGIYTREVYQEGTRLYTTLRYTHLGYQAIHHPEVYLPWCTWEACWVYHGVYMGGMLGVPQGINHSSGCEKW